MDIEFNLEERTPDEIIKGHLAEFERLRQLKAMVSKTMSNVDTELADVYHLIEGADITHVSQSHHFVKELQRVLKKRRDAKLQYYIVTSFVDNLSKPIDNFRKKRKQMITKQDNLLTSLKKNGNEYLDNLKK